ncbi:glycosyltransferase [Streptomyces cavernae]|uniref:glycosyltransferase n=1 Tax=Streptomyces cavernae TaxID=2259034 RepID=UPI000FEBE468|nr:glycosyltransferase family 2 protein [Streptomyces cavernae]
MKTTGSVLSAASTVSTASRTPTVSVVVCAYTLDRWEYLQAAIGSLLAQNHPADEIILVVDHCQALYERASAAMPEVRVVPSTGSCGLSGARNTGVALAHGDVVAFLDDDAAAEPDWTCRLLAPYDDPQVIGVGGRVLPQWSTRRPLWFPPEFDWVVGCSYSGLPERTAPVRNFIGANMSFRRTELLAVGGFLDALSRVGIRGTFGKCDDTELCLRLAAGRPGVVLLYEPGAQVRHRVPESRTSWSYFRSRCYVEGLCKAVVAWYRGSGPALASERAYLLSAVPQALARSLRRPGQPGALRSAAALSAGVSAAGIGYLAGRVRPLGARTFFRREQAAEEWLGEIRS